MKPLASTRVVDLTQILSGPYASQILADLGAEVIKVEPLWGDKARRNGPQKEGLSTYFASLNRGKKSLALDLKTPEGREILEKLVARSDVLLENFRPGVMEKLGLGYEALSGRYPALIYASCSGFGHQGDESHRPALDIVIQAMAGTMSVTGEPQGDPVRVGFSVGDVGAGLYLAIGVLAALEGRRATGQGSMVDISMLESQVALMENAFARYFATSEIPTALGSRHAVMFPFQAYPAEDGYLVVAISTEAHWKALCEVMDLPDMARDPGLADPVGRLGHAEDLDGVLRRTFRAKKREHWLSRLARVGVPAGPIQNVAEASEDASLAQRGTFVEVNYGGVPFKVVGTPLYINDHKAQAALDVPDLGSHTREVLEETLGLSLDEIRELYQAGVVK